MSNSPAATSSKAQASGPPPPAQNSPAAIASGDSYGQRRGGSSFGAGAPSRPSSTPRNSQQGKRQNKPSKRFRQPDEDAIAETMAMRSINSRKGQTSITHLMNFSLPPLPQTHRSHYGHGRGRSSRPTWGLGSGYHAVDKARYVHANYRFIVDPRGDYRPQSIDADIHLDWKNVLQILASSQSQDASCPICLGTPVAPRMAKCGHIFCLPCLIRYLQSEDEGKAPEKKARSKPCPLCGDNIYMSETRPVRWYVGQEGPPPREGGDVVLRLVVRSAGSTLAMPRDGADALAEDEDVPWFHAAEVMDYSRVMRGGEAYMLEQYDDEVRMLEQQEKEDELMFGEDNIEWVRKAVRSIKEAKEKVKGIGDPPETPAKPADSKQKRPPIVFNENPDDTPEMYSIINASKSGQALDAASPSFTPGQTPAPSDAVDGNVSNGVSSSRKMSMSSQSSKTSHGISATLAELRSRQHQEHNNTPSEYYFYQALLHYYLSPLDIRILKAEFGNFSSFPSTILPRVERVFTAVVDDDLRRRTKYLAHLPYGCEVSFLECDWTDTVSPEVLARFAPEIQKRRKRNQDKETREEKERLRAERAEYAEFTNARRRSRPDATAPERFRPDDFVPLLSGNASDSASTSPPWPPRQGQGFASLVSPSTSPSASRTVWGTTAVAPATSPIIPPANYDWKDDGWLQGWEKDLISQEDELLAEAQALSLGDGSGEASSSAPAPSKAGGKKGKKKKITLMSTNVRRGA